MKIAEISIKNFRCFKHIQIHPSNLCLLIGENDSGKTAILHALRMILGRWRPMPDDIYTNDPNVAPKDRDPIEIEVVLIPEDPAKGFTDDEHAFSSEHFDIDDNGNEKLRIKLRYGWDSEREEFRTEIRFQKRDGDGDEFSARYANQFGFFLIDALRDITREIANKTGLWGRLLSSITLSDTVQEKVSNLFRQANEILQKDPAFKSIKERFESLIEGIFSLPSDVENVRVSPIPQEAAEILRSADLHVRSKGSNVFLPISKHGMGAQSAAVIALFRTWAERRDIPNIFFGFEEPEAHLHPHVQRYLFRELTNLGAQVFITTHSTFIADQADLRDIVLLHRKGDESVAHQIPSQDFLPPDWEMAIKRYIEGNNSEIFFARCILLVEGDSEKYAFPLFAKALNIDFDRLCISLIPANSRNFAPFIRICSPYALNIPWVIMCDGDAAKKVANQLEETGYISKGAVKRALQSGDLVTDVLIPNDCYPLPDGLNFERFLLYNGFLKEYLQAIDDLDGSEALNNYVHQREKDTAGFSRRPKEEQVYEYVRKHGKPRFARRVAELITQNGTDPSKIPAEFQRPLERVKTKAEMILGIRYGNS
ncbi:MAG: AAA family ATPase [Deltaproteobacteria bacterium]|nr:AAA family ATPase [Deltaproteobacteria bacterium]